jgi:hypothetical protein
LKLRIRAFTRNLTEVFSVTDPRALLRPKLIALPITTVILLAPDERREDLSPPPKDPLPFL